MRRVRTSIYRSGFATLIGAAVLLAPSGVSALSRSAIPVAYDVGSQGPVSLVDADGSRNHQLTTSSAAAMPVWRPDGSRLAVTTFAGDTPTGTAVIAPDGTGERAVGPAGAIALSYSPDGRQLALTDKPTRDGANLLVVNADGGEVRSVWNKSEGILNRDAAWAPDGSRLALSVLPPGCYEADCPQKLWIVDADGAGLHAVPNSDGISSEGRWPATLEWSPDGRWILGDDLTVIRPDGTGRRQLVPIAPPISARSSAWSPDGTKILYVRLDLLSGEESLWVVGTDGSSPRSLYLPAAGTGSAIQPSWLPDGSGAVFSVTAPGAAPAIYTVDAEGGGLRYIASGRDPVVPSLVTRAAGETRVETAISLARVSHATADAVVIARDDLYPDALAAGPLAAKLGAPLLLSPPTNVPTRLSDEIRRLGATTAYLIGDETALSGGIEADVRAAGVTDVHRIGGATRYDTAALIAEQVGGSSVYIARGDDFPDAASVSALASYQRRPILLTTPSALPEATTDELRTLDVRHATIVGGGDAVSAAVQTALSSAGLSVDRLAGSTRYGTSAAVADQAVAAGMTGQNWLVDGANWPDAVAAGPAAAQGKGILLLVDPVDLSRSPETRDWLALHPSDAITAVGGPDVVSPADAVGALRQ